MKATPIPPDRSSWGSGAIVAELTAKRTADLIADGGQGQRARRLGGAQGRRLLRQLPRRGGHRAQGAGAAAADAAAHRRHQRRQRPGARARQRAARRRRRAQQHATRHGEPVRAVGRAGSRRSVALLAVPPAGRPRDARSRLLPRSVAAHGGAAQEVSGAHRRGADDRRRRRRARPRRRASSSSSGASPRRTRRASTPRTSRRATTTGRAPTSQAKAQGLDWDALLRRRGARQAAELRGLAAAAFTKHGGAGGLGAAVDVEGVPRLPRDGGGRGRDAQARGSSAAPRRHSPSSARATRSPASPGGATSTRSAASDIRVTTKRASIAHSMRCAWQPSRTTVPLERGQHFSRCRVA